MNRIPVISYSTRALRPQDRHEAWSNQGWPHVSGIYEAKPLEAFDTESRRTVLGPVMVHAARMTAQRYDRSKDRCDRDGFDHLAAIIVLDGEMSGESEHHSFAARAGDIFLLDLARSHMHVSSASNTILLRIPRDVASDRGIDLPLVDGAVVSADHSVLLRGHVDNVLTALPRLPATQAERVGSTVVDLLAAALDSAGLIATPGQHVHFPAAEIAARDHIEANLAVARLDVNALCRVAGVSRSALYRLFERHGGVHAYDRARRLEQVRRTLAAPGPPASVADLADRWGFADPSHLSRLFRARFGTSPSDYRAIAAETGKFRR